MTSWPDLLDALEQRTRQLADALDRGERQVTLPHIEFDPAEPLPATLTLRVQVLLAETARLQDAVARQIGPQARARAAYASH